MKTYECECKTCNSMSPPTMFISLPSVFTVYDTCGELHLQAFLVIHSVDTNLAMQPTVSGGGQKDREGKETRESFKRA